MSDLNLDVEGATRAAMQLIAETQSQCECHTARRPSYPAGAAGQALVDKGTVLAQLLDALHARKEEAMRQLREGALRARKDIAQYHRAEGRNTAALRAVLS